MEFGRVLKLRRRDIGMTQAALAERLEVDPVTVRRWEMGSRTPALVDVGRIEAVLGSPLTGWLRGLCNAEKSPD